MLNLSQGDTKASVFPISKVAMSRHGEWPLTEGYRAKGTTVIRSLEQTEVGSFLAACVRRQCPCGYSRLDYC